MGEWQEQGGFRLADLALEAGMAEGAHNVGVGQVLGDGHLHGGPIWGALYVFILLRCYDLQTRPRQKASEFNSRLGLAIPWLHSITKKHLSQLLASIEDVAESQPA